MDAPLQTQLDLLAAMCEGYAPSVAPYDPQTARLLRWAGQSLTRTLRRLESDAA